MNYEWSGYGEAAGGSRRARRGLCKALSLPQGTWEAKGLARYRLFLFDEGLAIEPESTSLGKGRKWRKGITPEARAQVVKQGGEVSLGHNLRKRIASFSTGVAIGGGNYSGP